LGKSRTVALRVRAEGSAEQDYWEKNKNGPQLL